MNRVLPLRLSRTASFYDGDTLTRKVTVSELSTETPDSELFTLPDGESVI